MENLQEAAGPLRSSDFRKALAELQAIRGQLATEATPEPSQTPQRAPMASPHQAEDPLAASYRERDRLKSQWHADVERLEVELTKIRALAAEPSREEVISTEMFRELEGLELSLVQERQRAAQLMDDKDAAEAAHARDVAALEGMLSQVMDENDRLRLDNKQLTADLESSRQMGLKVGSLEVPGSPKYLQEPEAELSSRAVNVDHSLYPRTA